MLSPFDNPVIVAKNVQVPEPTFPKFTLLPPFTLYAKLADVLTYLAYINKSVDDVQACTADTTPAPPVTVYTFIPSEYSPLLAVVVSASLVYNVQLVVIGLHKVYIVSAISIN
jgi:hypothetical protein